ncbi:PepSY-associated TM helix domain-containing protein [Methylovulum miyakonense]|uniref:PepSY-associated TM helix domain-containing protein n=1 Tax=Methylovulum miyakonense TaxID=645578 RepID=UPI00036C30E8|nr:PepSY-associated TM helix domain-containing protein [Methylovulum miyakonense]
MNTTQATTTRPPKSQGGYLFLPKPLARGTFLKWLRRTHAWLGLWGAALGLLFGVSGILLNHRDILKIPAAKMAQHELQLPLPGLHPSDPKALAVWLGQTLGIDTQHARIRREAGKAVVWNNTTIQQPPLWQISVRNPKRVLQADYWEGNAFVSVKQGEANFFALLTNLHKGSGMGIGWVLLADTLAGGLVVLSLTGTLLWTGLHGKRLAAAGLGLGSFGLAMFFTLQAIGE